MNYYIHLRIASLGTASGAVHLALNTRNRSARVQIGAGRRLNINVADIDVLADSRATALQIPNKRIILLARRALEVLDRDVFDGEVGRKLVAQRDVLLAIALSNLDGVVDVADRHAVVSHVGDLARSASALQITRQCRCSPGPDLDARTVRGV